MTFSREQVLPTSLAQATRSAGARGIFAFTGQISPNAYGVYMVDVDAGTIWCYECVTIGGVKKLRLVSARSWIFDRYLEDYNGDELSPTEVKELVEQERERAGGTESRPTP